MTALAHKRLTHAIVGALTIISLLLMLAALSPWHAHSAKSDICLVCQVSSHSLMTAEPVQASGALTGAGALDAVRPPALPSGPKIRLLNPRAPPA